jgi:polyisoprenoid-binding protein YceI
MRYLLSVLFIASVSAACTDPSTEVPAATVAEGEAAVEAEAAPEGEAAAEEAAEAPAAEAEAAEPEAPAIQELAFSNEGSTIGFTGSKVTGSHDGGFNGFTGTVQFNPAAPESSTVSVTIDMTTIFSDDERLTGHLMSEDFFDVENIPTASFTSTSVAPLEGEGGTHTVTGDLTLHGVTKTISFPATVEVTDSTFSTKAEFSINRSDFEITYPGRPDDLIREGVVIRLDINAPRS